MKKKVFAVLLAAAMVMSLVACGDGSSEAEKKEEKKTETDSSNKEDDKAALTEETSLSGLEEYLLSEGVLTGERTETAASMVGAVSGFKYADTGAEFYEYDENSDAYKQLSAGESVEIEGMSGYSVSATAINGKYVLIASNDASLDKNLIDKFYSYK